MDFDYIECGDCLELLKTIPDNSVDLVVTDPPYEFVSGGGGGAFGSKKRDYHAEYNSLYIETGKTEETERLRINANKAKSRADVAPLSKGFDFSVLDECCRILKAINIYVWCSKGQLRKLLDYFEDKDCSIDLLTWHKTNPVPTCNNTYLSDTEYCVFAREKGVKIYGTYATKKKWYATPTNKADKALYKHPTIKPLDIIENLIINSTQEGDIVLDPFLGSGSTLIACEQLNRKCYMCELDPHYVDVIINRYINLKGSDKDVFLIRDGQKIPYNEVE